MNIGTICYATRSGLGHLAKQFYDNGVINRILITPHPRYDTNVNWYHPERRYTRETFQEFLEGLHALVIFENAFNNWGIVQAAQRKGIKFILVPMYEWTPQPLPVRPNFIICPSKLDLEYFNGFKREFIPIPAPGLPWKERTHAIQFVHNAGHGQVGYAKGTPEVLEAFAHHVKSDATLLVRGQQREPRIKEIFDKYKDCPKITIVHDDIPYDQLFAHGDVYINAERYNGLSLPLQEAYSSGMLVMTTDRFPANDWLPHEPLIPYKKVDRIRLNSTQIERCEIDPARIGKCVDEWYGRDITVYSHAGRQWGEENSWEKLRPVYLSKIQSLVSSV